MLFAEADTVGLLIGVALLVVLPIALLTYAWYRTSRKARSEPYRWKPEQDYDLIMEGESAMVPASPRLRPRKDAPRWKNETPDPRLVGEPQTSRPESSQRN